MAEQQRMIVILSTPYGCIRCYQVVNCKLTDTAIKNLKHLIAKDRFLVKKIAFSYNISSSEANIKSTLLSHHVQKVTLRGSNMHSKGAYLMSIPATIQCNDKPYQVVADYLAAVLCHNIQTSLSYQKSVPASLAIEIKSNLQIQSFEIVNMNIGKEVANDLAAVLVHNTDLQELYLNDNKLESVLAVDEIAAVLSHNTELKVLELGDNNLQSAGAIKIAKALHNNENLIFINLRNNNIREDAADDIAAVLSHNTKLQAFTLGGNNLQSEGVIKIAHALHNTMTLTSFSLCNNNIGEDAADVIAAVLSRNIKLQHLHLDETKLLPASAIKIAKALQKNKNLTCCNLSNNNIREDAADQIAAYLPHNTKLYI